VLEAREQVKQRFTAGGEPVWKGRIVVLTDRGEAIIAAARKHRAAIDAELRKALGDDAVEQTRLLLVDVIDRLGASPSLRARAVRPPH